MKKSKEREEKQMKKTSEKNLLYIIIVLVVLCLGVGVASLFVNGGLFNTSSNPVVAEVKGTKIYLDDYKAMLEEANAGLLDEHVKEPVLNEMVELEVLKNFFATKNVTIDKNKSSHENLIALRDKFQSEYLIWKTGYVLFCRYDRGLQGDYEGKSAEAEELIATQKSYAKNYCDQLQLRLESGASFSDELKKLQSDDKIGDNAWEPWSVSYGIEFDTNNYKKEYFETTFDIFDQVSTSEIPLNKTVILSSKVEELDRDGMYALVKITNENTRGETTDYDKWLEEQSKTLNVKTYLENIK